MKKLIAITLALAMLIGAAAPAAAAYNVFIGNFHWVGFSAHIRGSHAWSGAEFVTNTGGSVDVDNDDATSTAGGVDIINTDVTDVGGPATTSYNVAVVNASGAGFVGTATEATADTGGDMITNTGGSVDLDNGKSESHAWGFTLTNFSITRVR